MMEVLLQIVGKSGAGEAGTLGPAYSGASGKNDEHSSNIIDLIAIINLNIQYNWISESKL